MALIKVVKDYILKGFWGKNFIPRGLLEMHEYFKMYGPVKFTYQQENGLIVAVSDNFRYGSIVTSGATAQELDKNIKDAILTAFEIPSSYASEAKINRVGERREYALA